ncbi:uncharacterized protein LOC126735398 [Anthonomus grandis grandis]|uniref:uncharacterized protein LOC126735398 n=1 Tax=Anthonomus grandis grandis TaxID=2921223 RepID=UPI0021657A8C|nr:uncharacterized protein LOC126735398 [Anthonomus grandis grandis]
MKYKAKWYYGKIIATEEHGSVLEESTETVSSDNSWDDTDNLPLSKVKEFLLTNLEGLKINDESEGAQISIIPRREEHGSILDKSTEIISSDNSSDDTNMNLPLSNVKELLFEDLKISKLNDESEGSKICIIPKSEEHSTVLEILAGDFALDNNLPFSKPKEILGKTLEDPQIVEDPQVSYKKKVNIISDIIICTVEPKTGVLLEDTKMDCSDDIILDSVNCEFKQCTLQGAQFCGCGYFLCLQHYYGKTDCKIHEVVDSNNCFTKVVRQNKKKARLNSLD